MTPHKEGEIVSVMGETRDGGRLTLGYVVWRNGRWHAATKEEFSTQQKGKGNVERSRIIIDFNRPNGVSGQALDTIEKRAREAATVAAADAFKMTKDEIAPASAITTA